MAIGLTILPSFTPCPGACNLDFQKRCAWHEIMKAGAWIPVKDRIGCGLGIGPSGRFPRVLSNYETIWVER